VRIVQQRIKPWSTKKTTISEIYVNEVFECHALEDADRGLENGGKKVYGETAIAKGLYPVVRDKSNRFGYITPRLVGVNQFTGIRIHPGNDEEDTDGCILPGHFTEGVPDWIDNSRIAFNKLDKKIEEAIARGETVTWEII